MNTTYRTLLLFFFLTIGSTMGGWVLTSKLGGVQAAWSFFYISMSVAISMIAIQTVLYFLSRRRLFYQLVLAASFSVSLCWFMLCLVLPILCIPTTNTPTKIGIFGFLVWISFCNGARGFHQFSQKWQDSGMESFTKNYDVGANTIDWQTVITPMNLSVALHLPGVSDRAIPLLSCLMVLSMIIGLSLWKQFPEFSAFAWGIPSSTIISVFVQMIGIGLAQAWTVAQLEKNIEKTIRPTV